jgi:hypothetical protein
MSSDVPGHGHARSIPTTGESATDGDFPIADYGISFHDPTHLVSQSSLPSVPDPRPAQSPVASGSDHELMRKIIALEQELEETKRQLESDKKKNLREVTIISRKLDASEAEVQHLEKDILVHRAMTEHYENENRKLLRLVNTKSNFLNLTTRGYSRKKRRQRRYPADRRVAPKMVEAVSIPFPALRPRHFVH